MAEETAAQTARENLNDGRLSKDIEQFMADSSRLYNHSDGVAKVSCARIRRWEAKAKQQEAAILALLDILEGSEPQ